VPATDWRRCRIIIPLLCDVRNDKLSIVRDSECIEAPLPIKPFIVIPTGKDTRILRRTIGSNALVQLERIEYDTVDALDSANLSDRMSKLRYIEQIYTESPDFFYGYPNDDPLKIMVIDIEVLTDGSGIFPNASRDPIVAIGLRMDGTSHIFAVAGTEVESGRTDYNILSDALATISSLDPDIIATYNGIRFDIPYLISRMNILGIDTSILGRSQGELTPTDIPSRIHWDMWKDVNKDQTLLGLPNKRLKTIGHHFGWSNIIDLGREALSNTSSLVGTPELVEYLDSDVKLTEQLVGVYIDNHIALAEKIGIPLREEINSYSSLIPKVIQIRNLKGEYIGLDSNQTKYLDRLGTNRYEAARVAIYDNGTEVETLRKYYPKISKVDFSSQYPTCMITFNLSPDTTRIYSIGKYTGEYGFNNTGDTLWLNLPDRNAGKQIVIRVDLTTDGFLRKILREYRTERNILKVQSRDDPDSKELYSRQWAIKVLMNSIYGYNGLSSARWGDLAVAIATVGISRWLIMRTEDYLGNSKVATDTDGVTVVGVPDVEAINKYLDKLILDNMGLQSEMSLEFEEYADGWFYRSKNYMYRELDGKVVRKGAVFKSSRHSRVYSIALDTLCEAVLNQAPDYWPIIRNIKDWGQYNISDFIMHTTLNQNPLEYSNPNSVQPRLARQAHALLDTELSSGDGLDYVVTKGRQYTIASVVNSLGDIDTSYYDDEVDKLLDILGIGTCQQLELW